MKSTQQGVIKIGGNSFKFLNGFLCLRLLASRQNIQKLNDVEERLDLMMESFGKNNTSFEDVDFFCDFIISGIEAANVVNKKELELPVRNEVLLDFESVMDSFSAMMDKQSDNKPEKTIKRKGK